MEISRTTKNCIVSLATKKPKLHLPWVSVEGESGRRQAAAPLADELEDVLTLRTMTRLI